MHLRNLQGDQGRIHREGGKREGKREERGLEVVDEGVEGGDEGVEGRGGGGE